MYCTTQCCILTEEKEIQKVWLSIIYWNLAKSIRIMNTSARRCTYSCFQTYWRCNHISRADPLTLILFQRKKCRCVVSVHECMREHFAVCSHPEEIVLVWVSGWISRLHQTVICLHWFKLFPLDVPSLSVTCAFSLVYTRTLSYTRSVISPPLPARPVRLLV